MNRDVLAMNDFVELDVGGLDGQTAARRHRVARVDARFISTCSSCPGSARTAPRSGAERSEQIDVLADQPAEHLAHAGDERVEIDDASAAAPACG